MIGAIDTPRPAGEERNPDTTAEDMLRAIECVHPFADIVDAVLRKWSRFAGVHDETAECGGES